MFRGNAPEVVDAEAVRKSFDTSSGSLVLRYRYGSKGFTAPTWEGYPTAVTGALLALTSAPTVTGTAKVGSTVKVRSNGSWTLTPSSYAYQWLRNGQAIKGATKTSHKVTNAHSGRPLSLRVTAKKAGHASGVATSKVLKVPKTSASLAKKTIRSGKPAVVKVKITTAAMKNPTGTVSVYRGKRFVGKAKLLANKDGVVNVKVAKLKKKGTHTLHVKYGGNVQAKGSNSKKFKLKIKK